MISDNSATTVSKGSGGGLDAYSGTTKLTDCTITGNSAASFGGGVYTAAGKNATLDLTDCTLSGNTAAFGGGMENCDTATLTTCTLSDNLAKRLPRSSGGGLDAFSGKTTLTDCTVTGNSAASFGGGVYTAFGTNATLDLTDCTVYGNTAAFGGGMENCNTATLTHCTINENTATNNSSSSNGGGINNYSGTTTLTDTIVAGNSLSNGTASDIGGNKASAVTGSDNLIGTGGKGGITNGNSGNIVLTSLSTLGLAPLGDYGGPTETMALLSNSAGIGKGTGVSGVSTDQRGQSLPASGPDIGAFQTQTGLTVNINLDGTGSPFGDLSLRQAVNLANALGGYQTIHFDDASGHLFYTPQTITLTAGPLEPEPPGRRRSLAPPRA